MGGAGIAVVPKNESHTNVPGTMTWLSETAGSLKPLPRRGGCVAVTTFETKPAHSIARAVQKSFLFVA